MNELEIMKKRLEVQGGISQESRMIKDKYKTFLKTLKYSYQGCDVQKIQPYDSCLFLEDNRNMVFPKTRALINPDKTKQDYDDKIISIDYKDNFNPGDVFRWNNTNSYWLVYLDALTEDAYFRSEIRRCKYQIKFRDKYGRFWQTWAAIRGPVETRIESIQKNQIRVDIPNHSLNILMPQNDLTLEAFDRYKEFIIKGKCWKVQAIDSISMINVLEVNAEEYYIDRDIDNDIKNGLKIEPIDPTPNTVIKGETFIKPNIIEVYTAPTAGGHWCIREKDKPVKLKNKFDNQVEVTWNKMTSGDFVLEWHKDGIISEKAIIVESLF